jgi:hypothetical protein
MYNSDNKKKKNLNSYTGYKSLQFPVRTVTPFVITTLVSAIIPLFYIGELLRTLDKLV